MAHAYHINPDEGLITVTAPTGLTLPDALSLGQTLLADPQFDNTLPQLIDLRELAFEPDHDAAKRMHDFMLNEYRPAVAASMAVVVDDGMDRAALAALYLLVCRLGRTELFDNYELALRWLMRIEFAGTTALATGIVLMR